MDPGDQSMRQRRMRHQPTPLETLGRLFTTIQRPTTPTDPADNGQHIIQIYFCIDQPLPLYRHLFRLPVFLVCSISLNQIVRDSVQFYFQAPQCCIFVAIVFMPYATL